ncbi:hypothetical protein ACNKHW_06865 [Shigella flexneri]
MPRMFCWYIIWVLKRILFPLAMLISASKIAFAGLQNLRIRQVILLKTLQISVLLIEIDTGNRLLLIGKLRDHITLRGATGFQRRGFITDITH